MNKVSPAKKQRMNDEFSELDDVGDVSPSLLNSRTNPKRFKISKSLYPPG